MKALVVERDLARFGAARLASGLGAGPGIRQGPLRLRDDVDPPDLPSPEWVRLATRLSGICGSDLATVQGRSSRWFEPIVSFPFVPGHEVVADDPDGRRVVVEPVLGCVARGVTPVCPACAEGRLGNCGLLDHGTCDAGLQTGYCCDTGGGWSEQFVAHPSQLHLVPDELDDRDAVLVEPAACAIHGALRAGVEPDETAAVVGAGTLGAVAVAALARWTPPRHLLVAARHPHQREVVRDLAGSRVPVDVCAPDALDRTVRRHTQSQAIGVPGAPYGRLTGGADVTIDCVGSAESISQTLAVTRPGGRVILVGMPGVETLDLTPLWQREISVVGAYAYGTETVGGQRVRTFDLAFELVAASRLGRLVSATYPLERHRDALDHADTAGRRGATKIAFSLHEPDHPIRRTLKGRR